ncbi:MAG: 3-deoxy-D-manno-octulosonic acid transferase [Planctomycetota bacterium]|jgi:3-deoxy-D-manno-octulosonic-acid transferase
MRILIDLVYLLGALTFSPVVIYRVIRYKRYRTGWAQRLGKIIRKHPAKECIWLHAVSVGEVNATRTIVREIENRLGDYEIVISTTTDTGFAQADALFGTTHTVVYFPFDFSWVMRRAFRNIRPSICLLMELEVWPNLVAIARRLDVPVVVVNGRITERSCSRYCKIKPIAKTIFQKVTLVLAQTDEYAQRFKKVGSVEDRVIVTGSLKYDTAQITDRIEGADLLAAELGIGDERLWVAGGTGPGEEQIILEVFKSLKQAEELSDLRLVIVPRKPERFDEVARLIADAGFDFVRYSSVKKAKAPVPDKVPVILGDTMGDLRKFYSLATVIFVGRSLVPMGGSDMMEAAALGKCTVFGPHASNFKQTVDVLLDGDGAIMVKDEQDLLATIRKCLDEPDFARAIARNGREVIRKNQGATQKTLDQIAKLLENGPK